jgi:uncharacterized membrane protein YgaE (UPF0421/DUF939 family)
VHVRALRAAAAPVAQTAAAAGISWFIASNLLGHRSAFFAPISAVIALGLAPGNRTRRAVEMVAGVAVGILIGDLLISAIGTGAVQLALVVALAMAGAVLLGGRPLVVSQAASSAVLVATIAPPSNGYIPTRFADALIGGAVGLAVLVVAPRNPVKVVQRSAAPFFEELTSVLDSIAAALEARDADLMRQTLERARGLDRLGGRLRDDLVLAEETVRLAPAKWSERGRIDRYSRAAAQLDLAVRNVRVLARAGERAVELEPSIPPQLIASVRDLGLAVRQVAAALELGRAAADARASALRAAAEATQSLGEGGFAIDALVGQVRSTATDILRALGIRREDAVEQVRAASGDPANRYRAGRPPGPDPAAPGSSPDR